MKEELREALKLFYLGQIAAANANIHVYFNHPVGIGEHTDIVASIDLEVEKAAHAQEKLDYIDSLNL